MGQVTRWGILGAAKIARTALVPAIQTASRAQLVALATRDAARADPFVALEPGLRVHDSYEALLADEDIDAIYIPLPNHLHIPWSLKALAAGKHVLCEKPIALQAADIDALIAARDASARMAAEGFMVCHHPQWPHVRRLLADGAIGRLVHVDGVFTYNSTDPDNIRNDAAMGGGGVYDIGVYPSVTTRFVTGAEPRTVEARLRMQGGVDVFARVWAEFDDFTLAFTCGMRQSPRQSMVFHGTDGVIEVATPFNAGLAGPALVTVRRGYDQAVVERFEPVDQYRLMVENFARSAWEGVDFACPLEFSRGNQRMIDMILEAGRAQAREW